MLLFSCLSASAFAAPMNIFSGRADPWFQPALIRLRVPWEEITTYHSAYTAAVILMKDLRIDGDRVLPGLLNAQMDSAKRLKATPEAFLPAYRAFLLAYQALLIEFCGYKGPLPYASWETETLLASSQIFTDLPYNLIKGSTPEVAFFPRMLGRSQSRTASDVLVFFNNQTGSGQSFASSTPAELLNYFSADTTKELMQSRTFLDFSTKIRIIFLALVEEIWGGDRFNAAHDPVFFLFLANMDRLWSEWQSMQSDRFDASFKTVFNLNYFLPHIRVRGQPLDINTIYITNNPPHYGRSPRKPQPRPLIHLLTLPFSPFVQRLPTDDELSSKNHGGNIGQRTK